MARAGEEIVRGVRAFCERTGADVWLREAGMLRVSAAPAQDRSIGDEVEAAQALGVADEAVPLSEEALAGRIRSPVFRRGVLLRDGATIQPARWRWRCAAPRSSRRRLHEHTRVMRIGTAAASRDRARTRACEADRRRDKRRRCGLAAARAA